MRKLNVATRRAVGEARNLWLGTNLRTEPKTSLPVDDKTVYSRGHDGNFKQHSC